MYLEENGSCRIFFDAGISDAFGSSRLSTIALRFSAREDFSSPLPSPLSDGSELPPENQTKDFVIVQLVLCPAIRLSNLIESQT